MQTPLQPPDGFIEDFERNGAGSLRKEKRSHPASLHLGGSERATKAPLWVQRVQKPSPTLAGVPELILSLIHI